MAANPLISTQKSSDTSLEVALHPLVLLTISDYITRHTLRQQKGPIVGALLGQQNGREITIEHAFECLVKTVENEQVLDEDRFSVRLQQMKDVHKAPALDLVGWYTLLPTSGPQPNILPIHQQILTLYNESAILLGFHPSAVRAQESAGGKLPLTIYESNYEADDSSSVESGEDKEMKDAEPQLVLKFKELPYMVETGEAEMISVDFVARGGGNATAVDGTSKQPTIKTADEPSKSKGKAKKSEDKDTKTEVRHVLSRADEELIASLTAKANAIKMLHARINLISTYLQNLPPSYTSNTTSPDSKSDDKKYTPVNHAILRSIQALLSRLSLLIPADSTAFERELISEQNDVNLVSLLSAITQSVQNVREAGRKYGIIDNAKAMKGKQSDRTGFNAFDGFSGGLGGGSGGGMYGGGPRGVGDVFLYQ